MLGAACGAVRRASVLRMLRDHEVPSVMRCSCALASVARRWLAWLGWLGWLGRGRVDVGAAESETAPWNARRRIEARPPHQARARR